MAFEMKDNTFTLVKNQKKQEERDPDYTGTIQLSSGQYYLDAWIKRPDGKTPFMSGRIGKQKQPAKAAPKQDRRDDDMPPF